jgi:hypothetical protein
VHNLGVNNSSGGPTSTVDWTTAYQTITGLERLRRFNAVRRMLTVNATATAGLCRN